MLATAISVSLATPQRRKLSLLTGVRSTVRVSILNFSATSARLTGPCRSYALRRRA